jgi:hypothetical protein
VSSFQKPKFLAVCFIFNFVAQRLALVLAVLRQQATSAKISRRMYYLSNGNAVFVNGITWKINPVIPVNARSASIQLRIFKQALLCLQVPERRECGYIICYVITNLSSIVKRYK